MLPSTIHVSRWWHHPVIAPHVHKLAHNPSHELAHELTPISSTNSPTDPPMKSPTNSPPIPSTNSPTKPTTNLFWFGSGLCLRVKFCVCQCLSVCVCVCVKSIHGHTHNSPRTPSETAQEQDASSVRVGGVVARWWECVRAHPLLLFFSLTHLPLT